MLSRSWARATRLWRSSGDHHAARRPSRPPELLYSVDETPPRLLLIAAALQHVALMASTSLVFPLILGREAGLSPERLLDFISLSMLALGVSTILLCIRGRFIGCGYLCPASYSQLYLGPSLFAVQIGGLASMFAMTFMVGILQVAMAPLLRRVRGLLPPEIAGLVVAIVGLSMAVFGIRYSLGVTANGGIQPANIATAGITLASMVVLNVWTKGYTRVFCVIVGTAVGYATGAAFGMLHLSAMVPPGGLVLLHIPRLTFLAWRFDASLLAPFAVVAVASVLQLTGNMSTAQRINDADWERPDFGSLSRGLAGNGVASAICGLIGSPAIASSGSNIGLSAATGITSRSLAYVIGIVLALLSLLPPVACAIATIPTPVIGASMFFTAAFIFINGLQMITRRLLDSRRIIVIGFSFSMAIMADAYHDVTATLPAALRPIFDNGLVLGTLCAVVLNLIMRIGVRRRVSLRLAPGHLDRDAVERFLSEQGTHWAARAGIVQRAIFGAIQTLEVLGDLPGGAEIDASFDEFNLDLRIRYDGAPLVIPEQRPSPRVIMASEAGERMLAGYLLRRSADRIVCRAAGERAEIHLHYDH